MTKSYPIKIWSGLLLDGHTQKIENALWEFIWLINKVTKEKDGIGYVLGGTPVKVSDIATDLKRKYQSIYRHLQQLKKNGYIDMKKAPYGLIITINNSKKFNNKSLIKNDKTNESFINNDKAGLIKNDTSFIKYDKRLIKNDKANKILKDIKDNKGKDAPTPYQQIINKYNSICKSLKKMELLTNKRKTAIRLRYKKYGIDKLIEVFTLAEKSNFLKGNNDRGWIADFDFVINENKIAKILEGNYKSREPKKQDVSKKYKTI